MASRDDVYMKRISLLSILLLGSFAFSACSKNSEQDDLAKAQECLDNVPQSTPESASDCFHYAEKYTSQQANILKCSIKMTSGGLTESRIVSAYNALKDNANNSREAVFMSALALNKSSVNEGLTKAKDGDVFCQKSGLPGLQYISGIIVAGTLMANSLGGVDLTDTAAVTTAVNTLLADCSNTSGATGTCASMDMTTLGTVTTTLANGYCASADSKDEVCANVSTAMTTAGGDPAKVGQALLCYLNNKTYNTTTGACN